MYTGLETVGLCVPRWPLWFSALRKVLTRPKLYRSPALTTCHSEPSPVPAGRDEDVRGICCLLFGTADPLPGYFFVH